MEEPIRVLQVCQRMEAAGVQAFIMNIYRNIDRSKVQFDFMVHYKETQFYDKEIEQLGGKIYKFSVREDYKLTKYRKELDDFFREYKYRIVHGHMDTLGTFYLGSAKKNGVPVRIAHSHSEFVQNGIKKYPRLFMIKQYSRHASELFACSEAAGKFMFGDKTVKVFNNAIDVEKFKYNPDVRRKKREELGISEDAFVVGNVGRFHVSKNHLFLLEVLNEMKKNVEKVKLFVIGAGIGENEQLIKNKIRELKLDENVLILKDRKDVDELYQAMDVYAMPSLFEGFPVSAVEAQAAGLPCVYSTKISPKVDLCNQAIFIPLENEPADWANQIVNFYNNFKRRDTSSMIKEKGFDIKTEAKRLVEFYLEQYNNTV